MLGVSYLYTKFYCAIVLVLFTVPVYLMYSYFPAFPNLGKLFSPGCASALASPNDSSLPILPSTLSQRLPIWCGIVVSPLWEYTHALFIVFDRDLLANYSFSHWFTLHSLYSISVFNLTKEEILYSAPLSLRNLKKVHDSFGDNIKWRGLNLYHCLSSWYWIFSILAVG